MDDIGLERLQDAKAKTVFLPELYASLYAHDARLARLIECWPRLTDEERQFIVDRAEHHANSSPATRSHATADASE